jgi:hypothetical protein
MATEMTLERALVVERRRKAEVIAAYFMNMSNSSDKDTFSLYSSAIFSRIFSSS